MPKAYTLNYSPPPPSLSLRTLVLCKHELLFLECPSPKQVRPRGIQSGAPAAGAPMSPTPYPLIASNICMDVKMRPLQYSQRFTNATSISRPRPVMV